MVEEQEVVCSMSARVLAQGANARERVEGFWRRNAMRGGVPDGSQSVDLNGAMEQPEEERNKASYSMFSLF